MNDLKMIAFAVPGGLRAASHARARIVDADDLVPDGVRDDLLLLLTELITNAVRHGGACKGTEIAVTVTMAGARVRVTVIDHGPSFVWAGRPSGRAENGGGYGLVLVDTLARAWGVHGDRPTTVWFELDVRAGGDGEASRPFWVALPIVRRLLRMDDPSHG